MQQAVDGISSDPSVSHGRQNAPPGNRFRRISRSRRGEPAELRCRGSLLLRIPPGLALSSPHSVAAQQTDHLALNANAIRAEYSRLISGIGRFERDRRPAFAESLEGCFLLVDQGDDDVAGFGRLLLADDDRVVLQDARPRSSSRRAPRARNARRFPKIPAAWRASASASELPRSACRRRCGP